MSYEGSTPNRADRDRVSLPGPDRTDIDTLAGLVGRKQAAEAESLARRIIASFPAHGFSWQALGSALKQQGRLAEAVAAQRQAVELIPGDAGAHFNLGNSLMASGQPARAIDSYRHAVTIQPEHALAHFNLGNALGALGQHAEAVDSYRRVLALRADFAEAHAQLAYKLMALGLSGEAEEHFLRVLAARPDDASIHNGLGVLYRGQGRMVEAESSYRKALLIAPDFAEAHNNLGNALRELGRVDEAESSYRRAAVFNSQLAEPHFNLGNILRDRHRLAEAEQSYRHALELEPRHLTALNNLGLCLKRQGRLEEARQCFETAIAIKPDFIQSHCNLSPLKTYDANDAHVSLFEDQRHQLATLPTAGRISYWFALGKMREDIGRHDDAFAAYAEGNRLMHEQFPSEEADQVALMERLQSVFNAEFFAGRSQPVHAGRAPIFIVGMPRSGTSLIEQILSTYPGIHGAGELTDLGEVVQNPASTIGKSMGAYPVYVAGLSAQDLRRLGEAYSERVWRLAPEAARIVDKMPANFCHVGMIHLILPHAKIIHAMRDPMDSCFSCYSRLFVNNSLDFSYSLETLGRYYVRYIELMRHWHRVLPAGTVLDLRYEDMVADTEGQARRLLDYLGLPWDERCLAFHQNRRVVRTASAAQVRKPIYRSSVARWKNFEAYLEPLLEIVKDYRPASDG